MPVKESTFYIFSKFKYSPSWVSFDPDCLSRQLRSRALTYVIVIWSLTFHFLPAIPPSTPPMAALTRLLKPSSISFLFTRSLSTTAAAVISDIESEHPNFSDPKPSRNFQWVFLGCPGVGKGTYASRLSNLLGVPHIATGDLVREELSSAGPLSHQLAEIVNQGKLVSDEIIFNLLSKRLEIGESKGESGFILDGFPRTIRQAEILDEVTEIDLVVNLKLREDVLVEKCLGRRICSQCGKGFNVASINAKTENGRPGMSMAPLLPPQHCASKLITRADDT
ncbi:putative adenylate kinase [Helianthus debilis subsp. tardiflorus]